MHTASPFIVATKVDDVVPPAVEGTLSILKSAAKYNSSIKRVIVTSSIASVMDLHPTMRTYTEEDWNTHSTQEIEEKGDATDPTHIYLGSKALAEKAAWEWYESAKEKVGWDLVAILPGFVFGPLLQEIDSPSQLNYSMGLFFQGAMSGTSSEVTQEKALTLIGGWVDVRDVADAHVAALTVEAAKNQRFITSNWSCCVQDISNAVHKINPNIPNRFPYLQIPLPAKNFDSGKSKAVLGIKYKSLEETTKDSLADFKKRGWIQ
ncbi:hypothetical protein BDP27DRAFT_1310382 [Rhodocollybia butyracea]|uniref:Thioester reductase (TE) domain-containing protein n=1 Tax=Rhodocollybia butyracea TaxID=206335 RepID=A0A9P5QAV0_9AGAR|nr:hypothetical protein BDP27DRAFT_1310382 [Rhodocollybia butyracea]